MPDVKHPEYMNYAESQRATFVKNRFLDISSSYSTVKAPYMVIWCYAKMIMSGHLSSFIFLTAAYFLKLLYNLYLIIAS